MSSGSSESIGDTFLSSPWHHHQPYAITLAPGKGKTSFPREPQQSSAFLMAEIKVGSWALQPSKVLTESCSSSFPIVMSLCRSVYGQLVLSKGIYRLDKYIWKRIFAMLNYNVDYPVWRPNLLSLQIMHLFPALTYLSWWLWQQLSNLKSFLRQHDLLLWDVKTPNFEWAIPQCTLNRSIVATHFLLVTSMHHFHDSFLSVHLVSPHLAVKLGSIGMDRMKIQRNSEKSGPIA